MDYAQGNLKPSKTLKFYYQKVDEAVAKALQENVADSESETEIELILIGHSIGGWIARSWLSEWCSDKIKSRVTSLITLGSPHNPPPEGTFFANIDQTRGLLSYINANFPGAFEKTVKYYSVISVDVTGDAPKPIKVSTFGIKLAIDYYHTCIYISMWLSFKRVSIHYVVFTGNY